MTGFSTLCSFVKRLHPERGSSLVEAAVMLPVLVLLLLGALDYGRMFRTAMAVTHAARAGAQYGSLSLANSSDTSGMQAKASDAIGGDITGFSSSAVRVCTCYTASTDVMSPNPPDSATCAATCTAPATKSIYVEVTGTATFTTIVNYPGIPHSVPITRTARMRAQ